MVDLAHSHSRIGFIFRLFVTLVVLVGVIWAVWPTPNSVRAMSNLPDNKYWVTNGEVYSAVDDGNGTIYLGGTFNYVGPNTGGGGSLDLGTGYLDIDFPVVSGNVYAVVSDGSGGWYIGGSFTTVGYYTRNRIAHIFSNGEVDPSFNPNAGGVVKAISVSGSTLYVGGAFTFIGGQSRNRIAALDTTTGLATSWNPNANNFVNALFISGSTVYAGGMFSSIGGQSRSYIAALDATTGLATSWNPGASSYVHAFSVSGSTVYVGGEFASIGGESRSYIAALDATTGLATSWNPNASFFVFSLLVSESTVYAGGMFSSIGGQSRSNIAALDTTTGLATSWNPNASSYVMALSISGSTVYAGGDFTLIGGQNRNRIAALDATTGLATSWNPNAFGVVRVLSISGSTVYAGGDFTSIGGQSRNNIAALDASTGLATGWNPSSNNSVYSLAVSGTTVYVGGQFTSIGGQSRNRIAALDATTGLATSWNPNASGVIRALSVSGSTVYTGGAFTSIGEQSRSYIAALDATTGLATTWNPNASGVVRALSVSGLMVYTGGDFTSIGGQSRSYIAALDATTGLATDWNPSANNYVYALSISGSTVYAGGMFSSIGGQSWSYIAALDATTGLATSWNPGASGSSVRTISVSGSTVYVGGQFSSIGGQSRNRIAALDATTGLATSWNPNASDVVNTLFVSGSTVYAGGAFTTIGGFLRRGFAAFRPDATPPEVLLTPLDPDPNSDNTPSFFGSAVEVMSNIVSVQYQVDGTEEGWSGCTSNDGVFNETTEDFTCTVSPGLTYGEHTIYIRATNSDGAITAEGNEAEDTFTISLDTTPPEISLYPVDPDPTNDTSPVLTGTVTETDALVFSVEYIMDGSGDWSDCTSGDEDFNERVESFTCEVFPELMYGDHTIFVRATNSDGAITAEGNEAEDTFTISLDTTPPEISLNPVDPDPTNDTSPVLTGTAREIYPNTVVSLVEYQVDGSGVWTGCTPDDGMFDGAEESFTCEGIPELTYGEHTIFVRAMNSDGVMTAEGNEAMDIFTIVYLVFPASSLDTGKPQTDGTVNAIVDDGTSTYIAGEFTTVVPGAGAGTSGVVVNSTDGSLATPFPKVNGAVSVAIPDGIGGWYIGGDFSRVGNFEQYYLAHINPDGSPDGDFLIGLDGSVSGLALSGGELYIGGSFYTVNGIERYYLAKVDAQTGMIDENFNASVDNSVSSIMIFGDSLYIGGGFSNVGGVARQYLAKLDTTTGVLDEVFDAGVDGVVYTMSISGDSLFVGGLFQNVGGGVRSYVAKVSVDTGTLDEGFDAGLDSAVYSLVYTDESLYLGGEWGLVMPYVAKVDAGTGTIDPAFSVEVDNSVGKMAFSEEGLYIGGVFSTVNSVERQYVAKVNPSTGVLNEGFDPTLDGGVIALSLFEGRVYVGGNFSNVGAVPRYHMAKIDDATGEIDPIFNPFADYESVDPINSLALYGNSLYAGGGYYWYNGEGEEVYSGYILSKIDTTTGQIDPVFAPEPNASIYLNDLLVVNGSLYVGGAFQFIGGLERSNVAKLDLLTGAVDSGFDANIQGSEGVYGIAASISSLYLGGNITSVAGIERYHLAKVDIETGELDEGFDPVFSNSTRVVALSGDYLYVGGGFYSVDGYEISEFVRLNKETGDVDPTCDFNVFTELESGTVYTLAFNDRTGYVGGDFDSILDGVGIIGLFRFDTSTCIADLSWNPNPDPVYALSLTETDLWAGGGFETVEEQSVSKLAHWLLDGTIPSILLFPVSPDPTSDSTPVVTGTATDTVGVVLSVEYQVDETSGLWMACTADDGAFGDYMETFTCVVSTDISDGTHTIFVRASDSNGNTTAPGSESSDTFLVDTIAPQFNELPGGTQVVNLTEGQVVTENPYVIRVKPDDLQDGSGIEKVEFYVDGTLICTDTEADVEGVYECSWDTSLHHSEIRIVVYDRVGNMVELTREVDVDLTEDTGDRDDTLEDTGQNALPLMLMSGGLLGTGVCLTKRKTAK